MTVRHRGANRQFPSFGGYEKDRHIIRGSGAARGLDPVLLFEAIDQ